MLTDEREGELRKLAMQIACMVPAERAEALVAIETAEAIVTALGQRHQVEVAKQIASVTPNDPEEAHAVLDLVREFLDYTEKRSHQRLHSLRRAAGFAKNDVL